jgi:hypothetical protein
LVRPRNTKREKYHCTIDLLFDWFGLVSFANKNKNCQFYTADPKPVKQEVNGTVILPPLVFPGQTLSSLDILLLLFKKLLYNFLRYFVAIGLFYFDEVSNGTARIRHQCRKTTVLNCHRFLINSGVEK